ncbi:MAG: twin-arginine translocase TatA/TatE family subunit [Candidatus Sulfotelmatobacter sp.]|jgi:sec-independent protein translocase protein TatA
MGAVEESSFDGAQFRSKLYLQNFLTVCQEEFQMFEGLFQPMHLMIIAGIALLIFGPKKLPELGKGMGEGIRGFKAAMQDTAPIAAAAQSKEPEAKVGITTASYPSEPGAPR